MTRFTQTAKQPIKAVRIDPGRHKDETLLARESDLSGRTCPLFRRASPITTTCCRTRKWTLPEKIAG